MVMIGFFTSVTELIKANAMREAVKTSIPKGTETINLLAFDRGYKFGLEEK